MMTQHNQKGSVLMYVILVLSLVFVLSAGSLLFVNFSMNQSSKESLKQQAYFTARSSMEFVRDQFMAKGNEDKTKALAEKLYLSEAPIESDSVDLSGEGLGTAKVSLSCLRKHAVKPFCELIEIQAVVDYKGMTSLVSGQIKGIVANKPKEINTPLVASKIDKTGKSSKFYDENDVELVIQSEQETILEDYLQFIPGDPGSNNRIQTMRAGLFTTLGVEDPNKLIACDNNKLNTSCLMNSYVSYFNNELALFENLKLSFDNSWEKTFALLMMNDTSEQAPNWDFSNSVFTTRNSTGEKVTYIVLNNVGQPVSIDFGKTASFVDEQNGSSMIIVYIGEEPATFNIKGIENKIHAWIFAPNATVHLQNVNLYGGVVASNIELQADNRIYYRQPAKELFDLLGTLSTESIDPFGYYLKWSAYYD